MTNDQFSVEQCVNIFLSKSPDQVELRLSKNVFDHVDMGRIEKTKKVLFTASSQNLLAIWEVIFPLNFLQ